MKKALLSLIAIIMVLIFLSACPGSIGWLNKSIAFGPFNEEVPISSQATGSFEESYAVDLTGAPGFVKIKDFSVTIEATLVSLSTTNGTDATATATFYFEDVAAVDAPVLEYDVMKTITINKTSDPTLVNAVMAVLNAITTTGSVDFKVDYSHTGLEPAMLELKILGVIKAGI